MIDDHHGSVQISEHFKQLYEKLYNEQNTDNLEQIESEIEKKINENKDSSIASMNLFTPELVKRAVDRLKNDISD